MTLTKNKIINPIIPIEMENGKYSVSESTAQLIDCQRLLDEQYRLALAALTKMYGNQRAESLINEKFVSVYSELRKIASQFILESINLHTGRSNYTEI